MPTIKKYQEKDKNTEYAFKYYLGKGYTPEQSSAIVGNLLRESGLNPNAVGDGGKAFGIAQWHPDRQAKAKVLYGDKWTDFNNQLAFVDWELNNTEVKAGQALKNTKTAWEAGRVFTDMYERPKVKFLADTKRQDFVANTYTKHGGIELSEEDKVMFNSSSQPTTPLTNFDISLDSTKFASVPDAPQEEKPSEALNKLKEESFIQEYKSFFPEQQAPQQQEQVQQPLATTDVQGIFNEVSQFVDSTLMQSGGEKNSLWKNIRANRGSGKEPTKEMLEQEAKIKRNAQQGIVKDNNGYWNPENWGKKVEIEGGDITMKGVNQILEGYSPETGERKLMYPNKNYTFPNAVRVVESQLKQNEIEFLKSLR